jgi:hypothetical protein
VYDKLFCLVAVVGEDPVFFFNLGKGEKVCYAILVIPNLAVARKIAYPVCAGHARVAFNMHHVVGFLNILQELRAAKNIYHGQIVQQYPVL